MPHRIFPFAFTYNRTRDLKRLLDPFLVSSALSIMGLHYPYLVSINFAVIAPALLPDLVPSLAFISVTTSSLYAFMSSLWVINDLIAAKQSERNNNKQTANNVNSA